MTTITSTAAGDWSSTSTWDTATVPTASDDVIVATAVTVSTSVYASTVTLAAGGSLEVDDSHAYGSQLTASVGAWYLDRVLDDTRTLHLDGVLLSGTVPAISCIDADTDGLPVTGTVAQNDSRDVIISDPGYIGASATLQDVKPEGCATAYARKVSNAVRYVTVTVRIRASMPRYLGHLMRMAAGPFQVLLSTDRALIKGYIETVAPDQGAVGSEYITVRVTVAEGA